MTGEIVFNTGVTGYQESIYRTSRYNGRILRPAPLVGNYGVNRDDYESISPPVRCGRGSATRRASNWRNQMTLDEFFKGQTDSGIAGIDTRALTKIIRQHGTMRATLANKETPLSMIAQLRATVLPYQQYRASLYKNGLSSTWYRQEYFTISFGLKHSILRELSKRNCNITV